MLEVVGCLRKINTELEDVLEAIDAIGAQGWLDSSDRKPVRACDVRAF
ncbi:MAG TPA: hypothetical protein VFO90_08600 [Terrimicrobiaceae bacterium]|nr:hypothetical protein [Terrimicrobiaceae bacterium]